MRKLTRNLATGLAAGALAIGAMLPALAQGADDAATDEDSLVETEYEPVRARERDAVRDPEMTPAERDAHLEERAVIRAQREEQHRERVDAAVEAGDLTEEQAQQRLEAREQRAERGAGERGAETGQRGPGAGAGSGGPVEGGRGGGGVGPRDGNGPHENCPND